MRKRWYVLVVALLVGGGAAAGISFSSTPLYQSTANVYFAVQAGPTAADLSQSGNFAQSQIPTFASFADQPIVLDPVIKQLKLKTTPQRLAGSVTAVPSSDTVFVQITVSDPDARQAAVISNAVAAQLATTVTDLSVKATDGTPTVVARIVAPALTASAPFSPRTGRNVGAGLLAGLLIGFLLAYGWERLDNKVRTVVEALEITKAPLLGQLWSDRALSKGRQVMIEDPHGPLAEAVRSLRTNLQFLRLDGKPLVTIVTSALPGEGKTTTAVSVAIALAETGAKVVLIDADLRRPSVAGLLNLEGGAGLTTVLIGRATLEDVLQPWGDSGLDVLPSGLLPPNPSELLGSQSMVDLLQTVTAGYDFVLLDSAPLLPVTDTAVLALSGAGVIIVNASGEVSRQQLRDSAASIMRVGGHTLGVVMNKVPPRSVKRSAYSYTATSAGGPGLGSGVLDAGDLSVRGNPVKAGGERIETGGVSIAESNPIALSPAAPGAASGRKSDVQVEERAGRPPFKSRQSLRLAPSTRHLHQAEPDRK